MPNDPLSQLRDVHLPEAISFWPPAIGWWIVALFVLVIVVGGGYFLIRTVTHQAVKRAALRELKSYRVLFSQNPNFSLLTANLSMLLRRMALARFARSEVAGLTGDAWLSFLDRTGKTHEFSNGVGKIFATMPYQSPKNIEKSMAQINPDALFDLTQKWIKKR